MMGSLTWQWSHIVAPSGGVSILPRERRRNIRPPVNYPAGRQPFSIVAADFNHDGNLDLAVANSHNNYVSVLLGKGDGTFQAATHSPPLPQPATFVTTGDFTGDGKADLVAIGSNVISVLLGNGDGSFRNAVTTQPSFAVESLGAGDFNGDGKLDLATAGTFGASSSVNILLGNGDGTFQYGAVIPAGKSPSR